MEARSENPKQANKNGNGRSLMSKLLSMATDGDNYTKLTGAEQALQWPQIPCSQTRIVFV